MHQPAAPDNETYLRTLSDIAADHELEARIATAVLEFGLAQCPLPVDGGYDGDSFRDAVILCVTTLRLTSRHKPAGASAHWWVKQAVALSGMFGDPASVPRAAMIVAAHIEGIEVTEFQVAVAPGGVLRPSCSLAVGPTNAWAKAHPTFATRG